MFASSALFLKISKKMEKGADVFTLVLVSYISKK